LINNELKLADDGEGMVIWHRLNAGRMLVDLRRRVEPDGEDWWPFAAARFTRSRGEIEKLLQIGRAGNPEEAAERERAKNAEQQRKSRAKRKTAPSDVKGKQTEAMVTANEPEPSPQSAQTMTFAVMMDERPRPKPEAGVIRTESGTTTYTGHAEYKLDRAAKFTRAKDPQTFARGIREQHRSAVLKDVRDVTRWATEVEEELADEDMREEAMPVGSTLQ
jgi:hypothetical protein